MFIDGDRLTGTPGDINAQGLVWNAENLLHQPSTIRLDSLLEVRLQGGPLPPQAAKHQALVRLTNGDTIRGELVGLDEEYVTLDTWYGGTLRIKRLMAADLEIIRSEQTIYSGPANLDNWTRSGDPGAWSLQDGELIASRLNGSVARKIELPDRCHISFTLAWRSNLRFRLLLFSDEGATKTPDNCYQVVCQTRFLTLRKRWTDKGRQGDGAIGQPATLRNIFDAEKATMDIYVDRKTGTIAIYLNGTQAKIWTDVKPEQGEFGNWLHFVSEQSPLRISKIRASAWKGDLPENSDLESAEDPIKEEGQVILLQNGDTVIGEVGQINDGILAITTKHGDIPIPVERMRTVNLTSEKDETPKRMKGDVRGWLREGGRITFRLDSFREGKLDGYSQTFGESTFELRAFSRLEFNIYQEDLDHLRGGDEW